MGRVLLHRPHIHEASPGSQDSAQSSLLVGTKERRALLLTGAEPAPQRTVLPLPGIP